MKTLIHTTQVELWVENVMKVDGRRVAALALPWACESNNAWEIIKITILLGVQLSSRCLSKCWSILTYSKRHEIFLVVWKCLILCQIIFTCGKCWFSSFIRRKRRLKRNESSKKFTKMLLYVKQRVVIGSVASKAVILMLTTVRVKDDQKPSKTLNWRHCSTRIRAKRKKSLLQH